jgi:hypothetical protein
MFLEMPTNFMAFNINAKKNISGVYYSNARKFFFFLALPTHTILLGTKHADEEPHDGEGKKNQIH